VSFPLTLSANQFSTLEIEFDPTTAGVATGQVIMISNSSTNPTAYISLSGTGEAATYEVQLSWNAPINSSDPVAGYEIYRADNGSSSYQLLNSAVDLSTTYIDSAVVSGASYIYYVESIDTSGSTSGPSNTFTANIP
jgi:fibronectin type 3 domain-containing protein